MADANPVLTNGFDAEHRFSSLVPDESGGARLATQTLLVVRSAPVGFIDLREGDVAGAGRLRGYRSVLDEVGLPSDDSYVIHTGQRARGATASLRYGGLRYGSNAADGYQAARGLFRRHPDLSLLFCGTDRMAMGAYDYLKETGRYIPQDVAVVGFDNQLLIATQVRPPLTTIALPRYEMGRQAVQLALGGADVNEGSDPRRTIVAKLGSVTEVLSNADPLDKAEIFRQLGLRLTYNPGRQLVTATVQPDECGFSAVTSQPG